jgi:hypothetical protein
MDADRSRCRSARHGAARLAIAGAAIAAAVSPAAAQTRPRVDIADPAHTCPEIAGSFVALLDRDRGMLLLSGDVFLGGRPIARSGTGGATLAVPQGGTWVPARVSVAGGTTLFGAVYPFTDERADGCVAFDRDRFSSEGDLVTYLRWVVDGVYLALPATERERFPAFRIAAREVRFEVRGLGFQPLPLAGREGSTIAFRLPGIDRTYLITPFVVDEASSRVACQVASTAEKFWVGADKSPLGWVVATPAEPGTLPEPPLTVAVAGIDAGSGAR